MPSIAQEVGANTVAVSLIQSIRIFLVVSLIPFFALGWEDKSPLSYPLFTTGSMTMEKSAMFGTMSSFLSNSIVWTLFLTFSAIGGYYIAKKLKFPAARLVGGIIGVSVVQIGSSYFLGTSILLYFPSWLKIAAEIFLGASIGVSIRREMFAGMEKVLVIGLICSVTYVLFMAGASVLLSEYINLPVMTSILAFAPGGVAEMTITAVVLKANVPFVVVVQTLRLILIFLLLPPTFQVLNHYFSQKNHKLSTTSSMILRR